MASKIQKLKRWLCRVLECPEPVPRVTTTSSELDVIHYDGYDIEVRVDTEVSPPTATVMVYLKGMEVLEGVFVAANVWQWVGGIAPTAPSYKTRKYIRDYALTKLAKEQQ
jgi:hypothetical protein